MPVSALTCIMLLASRHTWISLNAWSGCGTQRHLLLWGLYSTWEGDTPGCPMLVDCGWPRRCGVCSDSAWGSLSECMISARTKCQSPVLSCGASVANDVRLLARRRYWKVLLWLLVLQVYICDSDLNDAPSWRWELRLVLWLCLACSGVLVFHAKELTKSVCWSWLCASESCEHLLPCPGVEIQGWWGNKSKHPENTMK